MKIRPPAMDVWLAEMRVPVEIRFTDSGKRLGIIYTSSHEYVRIEVWGHVIGEDRLTALSELPAGTHLRLKGRWVRDIFRVHTVIKVTDKESSNHDD